MRAPLSTLAITTAIGASLWLGSGRLAVTAQTRFRVMSTQPLEGIRDLQVVTVRDDATARCYAAFVLSSPNAQPLPLPRQDIGLSSLSESTEKIQLAIALKDLIARREREFADLRARSGNAWLVNYETARIEIQDEYERSVRDLLPDLYPSAQVAPGWPTTSPDELAAAVRRAIAEGEAQEAALEAARSRTELNGRLLGALTANQSALAVVGPIPCQATR
jgi:hypothetical protein